MPMRFPKQGFTFDQWQHTCGKSPHDRTFRSKLREYFSQENRSIEDLLVFLRENGGKLVVFQIMSEDDESNGIDQEARERGRV